MRKRFPSLKSIVQYGLLRSCEEDKVREAWWSPVAGVAVQVREAPPAGETDRLEEEVV